MIDVQTECSAKKSRRICFALLRCSLSSYISTLFHAHYIYVNSTPEKCFNPSALFRLILNINRKVAEGFDF